MNIRNVIKKAITGMVVSLAFASSVQAAQLKEVNMCAFTFMGEGGPDYQYILDYQAAALNWGVKLKLKTYVSEKIAVEELKAGACDIANMTSINALSFNRFTGSLDAPGGIPTYDHLRVVLTTLATPKAAKYMRNGEYEVVAIAPMGAIFIFTNDRKIRTLADLAGKKMVALDSMPEMRQLVKDLGMTPVSSTITNMFQKFNNGAVDIAAGPAMVVEMMGLHKGLEPDGGILTLPLVQASIQYVARWKKLPADFGQKSREYFISRYDDTVKVLRKAESNIPKEYWFEIPEESKEEVASQIKRIRLAFIDKGIYDPKTLTLLRKVRCRFEPTLAECTATQIE